MEEHQAQSALNSIDKGDGSSIPLHRVIVSVGPLPLPIPTPTAASAFRLASTAAPRCCRPTTTSTLSRFPTTAGLVITFVSGWAHKSVVNRDGLVEKFGTVQRFDGG